MKDGKRYHYSWDDTTNSGYSELGKLIEKIGGIIVSLETAPTEINLEPLSIYRIVSPDIPTENPNPKYIDKTSRKALVECVSEGGILVILANDSLNCEFDSLNCLWKILEFVSTETVRIEL